MYSTPKREPWPLAKRAMSISHYANATTCETIDAQHKRGIEVMDREQAKKLGGHLQQARQAKQLSLMALSEITGITDATISRIETGAFRAPAPDKLAALAEALELPLADVFALAEYAVPNELPSFMPYMRSKYRDLPDEAVAQIEQYAKYLANEHGVSLDGPAPGEDENHN